ncbi:helix-turn-helix domain-containing protein [Streptomyces tsukubensis]|uniref:helix-turn-helix domain-containing protein n=1 Tax=Streptomyces tsukubensis TaxID=83656 RepID=UPI00344F3072
MGNETVDWHSFGDLKDAALEGNYGAVVRRVRQILGLSQRQFADGCGLSQTALSRLENRGTGGGYAMDTLARIATAIRLPHDLVGLAHQPTGGEESVQRRGLLTGAVAATVSLTVGATRPPPGHTPVEPDALRQVTAAYRRLDATTPSRDLADVAHPHLRLIQNMTGRTTDPVHHQRMAAAASEAASFTAWLAWDMADHGTARRWYGTSITTAQTAGNELLTAYQLGSLASFDAETGHPATALRRVDQARRQFTGTPPPLAAAWLASIEALAHAAAHDPAACDRALAAAARHTGRISQADPVAWPWIFTFDDRKLSACRLACAARLPGSTRVRVTEHDLTTAVTGGHDKQRALITLNAAATHLTRDRDPEAAFALATRALHTGLRLASGRIADQARQFRSAAGRTTGAYAEEFDTLLHTAYL